MWGISNLVIMSKVLARSSARGKLSPLVLAISLVFLTVFPALAKTEQPQKTEAAPAVASYSEADALRDLALWQSLLSESSTAPFATYSEFMAKHSDWPRRGALSKRAEERLNGSEPAALLLRHFSLNPPVSLRGMNAYYSALMASHKEIEASEALQKFWLTAELDGNQEMALLQRYGDAISSRNIAARADMMVWNNDAGAARALLPLLGNDFRSLINARIAIREGRGDPATLAAALPENIRRSPSLAYDMARSYARNDREDKAAPILLKVAATPSGKPTDWWKLRDRVSRWLLEHGSITDAYTIASQHGLKAADGEAYRDAEWMSGWIALRFKGDAAQAAQHFNNMFTASSSVISRARGAYWMGRTAQANGESEKAQGWYKLAATFSNSFYGQAAASEVNTTNALLALPDIPEPSQASKIVFNGRELVKVIRASVALPDHDIARLFMRTLAESASSQDEATLTVRLGRELHRNDLAALAGKNVGRKGFQVGKDGYPMISAQPARPETALVHAIIRQESMFASNAKSEAGAVGLMQLMPNTASRLAKEMRITHRPAMLTNGQHNVKLGSKYLADLVTRFEGSYILAAASYNAGPGRSVEWMGRFGDPSQPRLRTVPINGKPAPAHWQTIDWIEMIPFAETRNYVMRISEGVQTYRVVVGSKSDLRTAFKSDLLR